MDNNNLSQTVTELKEEIERLTRELDQASSEKIQSAKYGLVLLEEKQSLEQRCEELETLYENTKQDLHNTQEVTFSCFSCSYGNFFFWINQVFLLFS